MSQTKVKSGLIDFTEGIDSFIEFSGGNSTVTGNLTVTGTLVGYTPTSSLNISNWDTAYSYSQVGHLPLTGGTLTGQLTTSDTGTSSSIVITSDSIGNGAIDLTKNTNGTGIRITNNGVGSGIVTFNNSTGTGITIANTSTGKGLLIDNSSSTTGDPFVYTLGGAAYVKAKINYLGNLTLAGTITASGYNNSNWDTAYGWGNHASAGYLTDITTQTDSKYLRSDESDTMSGSLTVSGVITTSTNEGKLVINSTAANGKQYQFISIDTGNLGIYDGTAYRLWVGGNGNVGIGTTLPGQKMTIDGSRGQAATSGTTQNGLFRLSTLGQGYGEVLDFGVHVGVDGPASYGWIQSTNQGSHAVNYNLALNPNGGNVGIGTTSPSYPLDLGTGGTGNSIRARRILASGYGTDSGFSLDNTLIHEDGTGSFVITNPGSYPSAAFYINMAGNVGIGMTSPSAKLHIKGGTLDTTSETTYPLWLSDGGDTTKALILGYDLANDIGIIQAVDQAVAWKGITIAPNGGNVGIGETNPGNTLHILGTSDQQLKIDVASGGTFSAINFARANTNIGAIAYNHNTNEFQIPYAPNVNTYLSMWAGGSEKIRVAASGAVGIGTTNPGAKLEINNSSNSPSPIIMKLNGDGNSQGAAHNYKLVQHYPAVSSGNKLIIPFVNQGNLNGSTIVKIWGHSAMWNARLPKAFSAEFAVGHLSLLSDLTILSSTGNISNISIAGMTIEIDFASAYTSATANGIYLTLEYMTYVPAYSIIVENITMN